MFVAHGFPEIRSGAEDIVDDKNVRIDYVRV